MKAREPELARRIGHRDAALRRLRRTTVLALAGTGALAVACGGLAAKAFPGKSRHHATAAVVQTTVKRTRAANPVATPPPLVSAGARAPSAPSAPTTPSTPPPAPPPSPPAVTQAPPVAVSGGS
jgi:hypothetical protein